MDRNKILSKARQDFDEIEMLILIKSLGISTIIIPVLSLIFITFRIINSKYIISDLVSITLAQLSVSLIYQYIKTRKLSVLIIGLTTLILTIIFTICFIKEVVIWKKI